MSAAALGRKLIAEVQEESLAQVSFSIEARWRSPRRDFMK